MILIFNKKLFPNRYAIYVELILENVEYNRNAIFFISARNKMVQNLLNLLWSITGARDVPETFSQHYFNQTLVLSYILQHVNGT